MFRGEKAKTVGFILFVFMFISMPISNWYSYDSHQPVKLSERCFLVCLKSQPINYHCSQLLLNFYWIEKEPIGLKGLHLLQNKLSWGLNVCIQAWENCTGVTEEEWSWGKKWSILYHLLFFFIFFLLPICNIDIVFKTSWFYLFILVCLEKKFWLPLGISLWKSLITHVSQQIIRHT